MKSVKAMCSAITLVIASSVASGCGVDAPTVGGGPGAAAGGASGGSAGSRPSPDHPAPAPSPAPTNDAPRAVPSPGSTFMPPVLAQGAPSGTAPAALALLTGTVTDIGAGSPALGLAGTGTVASTASVRVSSLLPDGALQVVSQAAVDTGGSFSAQVPLNVRMLVAQALSAAGQVLGAVIVGASGNTAGRIVVAAPITTDTSLKVLVLLDAAGCASRAPEGKTAAAMPGCPLPSSTGAPLELLALDATVTIQADLVAAIAAALSVQADAGAAEGGGAMGLTTIVHALADASVTASRARIASLLNAGVCLDLDVMARADVDALAKVNAGLNAALTGQASLAQVTAQLLADLDAAVVAAGAVGAGVRVQAQAAADLAFAASLSASLAAIASPQIDAVAFAAIHALARIEANLAAATIAQTIRLAGAPQTTLDAVIAAGNQLTADVAAATNVQALAAARGRFAQALAGGPSNAPAGLLADLLLQTTLSVQALLQSVLGAVATLSAQLDTDLQANLHAIAQLDACIDVQASANLDASLQALIRTLAKFVADVRGLGPSVQADAGAAVAASAFTDTLAIAEVVLRVGL
jgi:hypothetical protein